ncbi:porin family protein [uncultured Hyphomonas sp.]|uniref:porin family protein n=1 Tax=uncultured Hyphomonas sp. TaxID=225298 RepID=UPI002AAAB588|nr:porin family protein [uncultured Hyphomonas sp.]
MKLALASLAALAVVAPAFADGNIELGAGYSHFDTDGANLDAFTARGTYFFNPHVGVEGEASIGIGDDQIGAAEIELDSSLGAFGVVQMPVAERVDLFARAGYATNDYSIDVPGAGSASGDDDGLAYGVGGKVYLTERFGVRADLTRYEGDDTDADVIAIGGIMKF